MSSSVCLLHYNYLLSNARITSIELFHYCWFPGITSWKLLHQNYITITISLALLYLKFFIWITEVLHKHFFTKNSVQNNLLTSLKHSLSCLTWTTSQKLLNLNYFTWSTPLEVHNKSSSLSLNGSTSLTLLQLNYFN